MTVFLLLQVSSATGTVLWEHQVTPGPNQTVYEFDLAGFGPNGDVYLVTLIANSTLFALDGDTGAVRWSYVSPKGRSGSTVDGVFTDGKGVYVTTEPGYNVTITGLDVHTGAVLWTWGFSDYEGGGTMYFMVNSTVAVAVIDSAR
jgi:hypothetical protein